MLCNCFANGIIVKVVRKILGEKFSALEDHPKSNGDIVAIFYATILQVGGDKASLLELCHKLSKKALIFEVEVALDNIN